MHSRAALSQVAGGRSPENGCVIVEGSKDEGDFAGG